WEENISQDNTYWYINKDDWGITHAGIYHEECEQINPTYKKYIKLNTETGVFSLSYVDFWTYIYNEQAKYHLNFSIDKPRIKLVSIPKIESLETENRDCENAFE